MNGYHACNAQTEKLIYLMKQDSFFSEKVFLSVKLLLNLCSSTHIILKLFRNIALPHVLYFQQDHLTTEPSQICDVSCLRSEKKEVFSFFFFFFKFLSICTGTSCELMQTNIMVVVLSLSAVQDGGRGDGTSCWPGVFRPVRRCNSCFPFCAWAWP